MSSGSRSARLAAVPSLTMPPRKPPLGAMSYPVRSATGGLPVRRTMADGWRAMQERLARWRILAEQRRQLARFDDRMLKDIGLSRADAHQETRKWFWQQ